MSKVTVTGFVDNCGVDHAWGVSCPGHALTLVHNLSTDTVTIRDESGSYDRVNTYEDVIWSKFVELWEERKRQ